MPPAAARGGATATTTATATIGPPRQSFAARIVNGWVVDDMLATLPASLANSLDAAHNPDNRSNPLSRRCPGRAPIDLNASTVIARASACLAGAHVVFIVNSALASGVGRGITPVASCHAETRRLDEACRMRGLQRSGSRPASKTKWCLDTRPDVAPGLVHCTVRHNSQWFVSTAGACSGVHPPWMAE